MQLDTMSLIVIASAVFLIFLYMTPDISNEITLTEFINEYIASRKVSESRYTDRYNIAMQYQLQLYIYRGFLVTYFGVLQYIFCSDLHNNIPSVTQVESIEINSPRNSKTSYGTAVISGRMEKIRFNVGNTSSFDMQMEQAFQTFGYRPHEKPPVRYSDNVSFGWVT